MENKATEIMINVPVDEFITGQLATAKIAAVSDYINSIKYVNDEVVFGILGITRKEQENEPVSM